MDYRTRLAASRFWVITCRNLAGYREHHEIAALAIEGGADAVVMRENSFEEEEFIEEALKCQEACDKDNVPFLVCDQVNAAFIGRLAGLCLLNELGQVVVARKLLGEAAVIAVRANHAEQAAKASGLGADYLIVRPENIKEVSEKSPLPIIASGGVNANNVRETLEKGAAKILVCRAAMDKKGIKEACARIKKAI